MNSRKDHLVQLVGMLASAAPGNYQNDYEVVGRGIALLAEIDRQYASEAESPKPPPEASKVLIEQRQLLAVLGTFEPDLGAGKSAVERLRDLGYGRDYERSVANEMVAEIHDLKKQVELATVLRNKITDDLEAALQALKEIARPKAGGIEANDSDEDWIKYLRDALERERQTARAALSR